MRSTKIGRKILVGILCAAMVVQCVPVEAVASEEVNVIQEQTQEESSIEMSEEKSSEENVSIMEVSDTNVEETSKESQTEVSSSDESIVDEDSSTEESSGWDTSEESVFHESMLESETITTDTEQEKTETEEIETKESEEIEETEETELILEYDEILREEESSEEPTEVETENILMTMDVEEGLDNRGDCLYLHINRLRNNISLKEVFKKENLLNLLYKITDDSLDSMIDKGDSELFEKIRYISDAEAVLCLKKPESLKGKDALSVEIVQRVERETSGSESDSTKPDEGQKKVITYYETIARRENLTFESGILHVSYNPVNGILNMAVTSDLNIKDEEITVVTADESITYNVHTLDSNLKEIISNDKPVKLETGTEYYIKFETDENTYQQQIIWGEYKEGVPLTKTPAYVVVYRPYEYAPVFTYKTGVEDKTEIINGTSYYCFSQAFLSSKEINPKEEIYNIEFLDAGQNRIASPLTNVILAEDKWDGTYKIETLDGELEKGEQVTLYYATDNYDNVKITIENAKAEPKFIFSNPALIKVEMQKVEGSELTYTAAMIASAVGETEVTIKVGDIEESFKIVIDLKPTINSLYFIDEEDDKNLVIEGVGKERAIIVGASPKEAVSDEDIVVNIENITDESVVVLKQIEDIAPLVQPDESIEKEQVAYYRITLKTIGIGEAEVKIGIRDRDDISLTSKVTVTYGVFSDDQKQTLKKEVGALYAATNVINTLSEVELPKDWSWVFPDTELEIDPNGGISFFEARCSKESYTPFTTRLPVAITKVVGAYITGENELTTGHEGAYQINLKLEGYNVDLDKNKGFADYLMKIAVCKWQGDSMLTIKKNEGWNTTAVAGGTDGIAEGAVSASVTVGEDSFNENYNVVILANHITSIQVTPTEPLKNNVKFIYEEDEKVVYVNEDNVSFSTNTIKLTATASMENRDVIINKGVLHWKVNDDTLASLNEQEDGTVLLKILKSGTIIVTATAEDVGKKEVSLAIEVRDYKPFLETKKYTINKFSTEGVEIPIYSIEGNPVTKVSFEDTNFRVDQSDGRFMMTIVNKELYKSKTVINTKMVIRSRMSVNLTADVTITVDTNKPKITFKAKTVPNLFYTNTEAVYTVTSSNTILDITNDIEKGSVIEKGFEVIGFDRAKKQLTIRAKGLTAENVSEFVNKKSDLCKVNILVKYDGYGTISETIKLSPQNKKPQYKIKEISTTSWKPSFSTYLYDNKDKKEVILDASSSIISNTESIIAEKSADGRITVKYDGIKSKSYKLSFSSKNWTSSLVLTGKISVVKNIATVLGQKSITLNMAHNKTANGVVVIPVEAKNNMNRIRNVEYLGANKNSEKLLESGYLRIDYNEQGQQLEIGLADTVPEGIKAGTYTIAVKGYLQEDGLALTKTNLKITLVSDTKKPTVKLTPKSNINLIDRENTAILYTPKIQNMTASITAVKATGADAKYFKARLLSDGRIEVKAISDMPMSTTTRYTLGLEMSFDNHALPVTTNVVIKPVNKLPNIKASATKAMIYRDSGNIVKWNVYNTGDFGSIESVVIVENNTSAKFDIKVSKTNIVSVSLKPEVKRTIKKGKYVINYQVNMKDAAQNAKPKTLKMTITVK